MAHMYSVLYSIRSNLIQPASAISHFLFLWKISFMWTKHILLNFKKKSNLCDVMFANIYFFYFLFTLSTGICKKSVMLIRTVTPALN